MTHTKGQHTKGPWNTQGGFVYDIENRIVCNPHEETVRSLRRIPGREREANARLIAACPALYEACTVMLDQLNHNNVPTPTYLRLAEAKIEAALALADGTDRKVGTP